MSIIRKIKEYYNNKNCKKSILFTTPSHSQGKFIAPDTKELLGEKFFKCDFSEIDGFDNLRNPSGIIKEVQDKLSAIYKSRQTFMLTNGSTSGILALMLSVLKENDKVLTARNCHISVFNGFVLTGAKPVWLTPEFDDEWGIYKGVTSSEIKQKLNENTDIKAVILTSPTYEGNFSEIREISKLCKQKGIIFIVDEAHGALLNFMEATNTDRTTAILCGADASVQSLHKTAGAPNPCALLHLSKDSLLDTNKVQQALNLINTTSPSYPLMLAIEDTVNFLASKDGKKMIQELIKNIKKFKEKTNNSIMVYEQDNDTTKILVKIKDMSGYDSCELLNNIYCIEEEFSNEKAMLFLTGIGTEKKNLEELADALNSITAREDLESKIIETKFEYKIPNQKLLPKEAFFSKNIQPVNEYEAEGKICAEIIAAYPPGIPLIIPGEIITKDVIQKAKTLAHKTNFLIIKK